MSTTVYSTKAIAIIGTNASGKSAAAVSLAASFNGEVLSADSRQVYRGLNIGTGKLSRTEMQGIPHHMIDLVEPGERFSVADFQEGAYTILNQILDAGRLPFVAGGTGLYVRAVVEGYDLVDVPPDYTLRENLEKLSNLDLHNRLRQHSKEAADAIDPRNRRRIIRAIEMQEHGISYRINPVNDPKYRFLQLGITWPRDVLRQRIERRLRMRLDEGMIIEVQNLIRDGVSLEWLHGIGLEYRYVGRFLQGEYRSEDELFTELSTAIYRFAVRQLAWFKKDSSIIWLDTSKDYLGQAQALIEEFIA